MDSFVALDVETANADWASICQVGIAEFGPEGVIRTWDSLVNPEDFFDGMNVHIHGIDEARVGDAPTFPDLVEPIREFCEGRIVVHHMPFDRVAMARACKRYALPEVSAKWLDSARVARRAWQRFAKKGYGLKNLAQEFDIALEHHDALSDAIAAGSVLMAAMDHTGLTAADWFARASEPISAPLSARIQSSNREGPSQGSAWSSPGA